MSETTIAVLKWVSSGEWADFYKIFLTDKTLTCDAVLKLCEEAGRPYPSWMKSTTKAMLDKLYSIHQEYLQGIGTPTLCDKYEYHNRSNLQVILLLLGVLRPHEKDLINESSMNSSSIIYFKNNDITLHLRSSYELAHVQKLLDSNLLIDYEPFYIDYVDSDGFDHKYLPDFLVHYPDGTKELHEVKAKYYLDKNNTKEKVEAGIAYCNIHGLKFRLITEDDIDSEYPKWSDPRILNKKEESKSDPGFITKINLNTYTPSDHPRYKSTITYSSIMDFINSYDKYQCSIYDIYNYTSRNSLIIRLRLEAPDDEKDIRYWACKYLKDVGLSNSDYHRVKLEYQEKGIRDFGLKTLDDIVEGLKLLDRKVLITDLYHYLQWSRNKVMTYFYNVLKSDPYEVIKEINSKIR